MKYFACFSALAIERFAGIVIPVEKSASIVVVPKLEEEKAKEYSAFKEVRSYDDSENPATLLNQIIKESKLEKAVIGVEETLPFKFYKMLVECSPKIRIEDASILFSQLRRIEKNGKGSKYCRKRNNGGNRLHKVRSQRIKHFI